MINVDHMAVNRDKLHPLARSLRDLMQRKEHTCREVGMHCGIPASTIRKWVSTTGPNPDLDALPEIERLLKSPRGTILARAGYVDLSTVSNTATPEQLIRDDSRLSPESRDRLAAIYDVLLRMDSDSRSARPKASPADSTARLMPLMSEAI